LERGGKESGDESTLTFRAAIKGMSKKGGCKFLRIGGIWRKKCVGNSGRKCTTFPKKA